MTNEELIKALRCNGKSVEECRAEGCKYLGDEGWCDERKIELDAADALEAQQKALDECAKQLADMAAKLPKEGEWIEKWRFKTDGTPFHKIGDMECSVCHGDMLWRYYSKYCPHCGALLRG